jgi:hypothetical protein
MVAVGGVQPEAGARWGEVPDQPDAQGEEVSAEAAPMWLGKSPKVSISTSPPGGVQRQQSDYFAVEDRDAVPEVGSFQVGLPLLFVPRLARPVVGAADAQRGAVDQRGVPASSTILR